MPSINIRLARLEQSAAGPLPAHIRRWLGESLTEAEKNQADAEWQRVQSGAPIDLSRQNAEARHWLSERGMMA
ncbi:hypothetical protein NS355_05090 [Sphingomonas yabuuchiae]|uniref:Uncharacterized protein n=1 Tax=Sphingomonas yabuuchiae TaxID=172044 RepID=A0A147IXC9_9SPHN|nr:hypothetical protein NS355_05090 [Sphingomonas yabuuchiae]